MGSLPIPVTVDLDQTALGHQLRRQATDRRSFLMAAAGLGLAMPSLAATGAYAFAEDATPPADDGGSHTHGGTGDSTPVPSVPTEHILYDPILPPAKAGPKEFTLVAEDATVFVGKDIAYAGWTFNGTIPGTVFRAVEGDAITLHIKNAGAMIHSVDTHAARTPASNFKNVANGETWTWSFTATTPGAFMYHCGTPPVLMHIGAGMYGAMIVDPKEGWSPAQEFVFIQSEFYFEDPKAPVKVPSMAKMMLASGAMMDLVTFNGYANQYVEAPIPIRVGEPVRIFVVNAGPNVWSSFHVVGAIFDKAYINANPANVLHGLQAISIGPGDGACVEFTVEEPGEYIAVNHAFGHATHGAVAAFHAT